MLHLSAFSGKILLDPPQREERGGVDGDVSRQNWKKGFLMKYNAGIGPWEEEERVAAALLRLLPTRWVKNQNKWLVPKTILLSVPGAADVKSGYRRSSWRQRWPSLLGRYWSSTCWRARWIPPRGRRMRSRTSASSTSSTFLLSETKNYGRTVREAEGRGRGPWDELWLTEVSVLGQKCPRLRTIL